MRGQDGDRIGEHAGIDEVQLAAAGLLGRGANELDANVEILRPLGGRQQERADGAHRDEVVATAVADLRQGVVFGEDRDRVSGRADPRAERSLNAAATALDRVAVLLQERDDARDGTVLAIRELGLGVDPT